MTDDRQRFEAVYREHYSKVLAYALARAVPEVAGDAAAETFVVAWRRFAEVPAEPIGWLLAVTRRTLANQRRSSQRQQSLSDRLAATAMPGSADPADVIAERRAIYAALDRLAPDDREILMLVGWDGLDRRTAAQVMNCSAVAFSVRLHRARNRFAGALAAEDSGRAVRASAPARPGKAPITILEETS